MQLSPLVPLLLLFSSAVDAGPPPTRAALRKAFEANHATLVEVVGLRHTGPGVLVGSAGKILTSVDFVKGERATVRREGQLLSAKVRLASKALKVALLEIDPPGAYPSTAVRLGEGPDGGDWLVALVQPRKGEAAPVLAQVVHPAREGEASLSVMATLPHGTPLFDDKGRLVAVVTGGGGGLSRALTVLRLKDEWRDDLAARTRP